MDHNVIKDLLPLYADCCCSEESAAIVREHLSECPVCAAALAAMRAPAGEAGPPPAGTPCPETGFSRIRAFRASVLHAALLYASFALIVVGVALEAQTPYDAFTNGGWAVLLVVPATGLLLALANWCFVRFYRSRKRFSLGTLLLQLCATFTAYSWTMFHYGWIHRVFPELFLGLYVNLRGYWPGALLTLALAALSWGSSYAYARMLGKE